MSLRDIAERVTKSDADTITARAFRRALGIPNRTRGGGTRGAYARADRYRGAERIMRQRYGVRL